MAEKMLQRALRGYGKALGPERTSMLMTIAFSASSIATREAGGSRGNVLAGVKTIRNGPSTLNVSL